MKTYGGLDYIPRERTAQGRLFEHASDCRSLLKLLHTVEGITEADGPATKKGEVFYIKLQVGDVSSSDEEKEAKCIFTLKKDFVDLTLKANGKAELYFHAHFWLTFAQSLSTKAGKSMELFDKEVVSKSLELQRLRGLAEFLSKVHASISKFTFGKDVYEKYVTEFGTRKPKSTKKLLEDLQKHLLFALISDDKQSLHYIEKLLVQLLGYSDISVRDQAVVFLNIFYDGLDWQLISAFKPVIRVVGQHFKVNITVNFDIAKNPDAQIFIGLSAPSPIEHVNQTILTWHKIDQRNVSTS